LPPPHAWDFKGFGVYFRLGHAICYCEVVIRKFEAGFWIIFLVQKAQFSHGTIVLKWFYIFCSLISSYKGDIIVLRQSQGRAMPSSEYTIFMFQLVGVSDKIVDKSGIAVAQ